MLKEIGDVPEEAAMGLQVRVYALGAAYRTRAHALDCLLEVLAQIMHLLLQGVGGSLELGADRFLLGGWQLVHHSLHEGAGKVVERGVELLGEVINNGLGRIQVVTHLVQGRRQVLLCGLLQIHKSYFCLLLQGSKLLRCSCCAGAQLLCLVIEANRLQEALGRLKAGDDLILGALEQWSKLAHCRVDESLEPRDVLCQRGIHARLSLKGLQGVVALGRKHYDLVVGHFQYIAQLVSDLVNALAGEV
mmetsp:Transcript_48464/g.87013  ORF Transcript_48464/g.87013 Transcript_48464/m.87013 type:complete len:247 (-) Transcript_48464:256-996(-)